MKTINELLVELETYLKDEIDRCRQGMFLSDTDQEYDDFWSRQYAYGDVLSWVEDYKDKNI